jgi:hypothetical protein
VHTPIVDDINEATDLWTAKCFVDLTEDLVKEHFSDKKILSKIAHQVGYLKSFWLHFAKQKKVRSHSSFKEINSRIKKISLLCSGDSLKEEENEKPTIIQIEVNRIKDSIPNGCTVLKINKQPAQEALVGGYF